MDVKGPMKSVLILSNFSSWCCYIDWYELKTILNVFFYYFVSSGAELGFGQQPNNYRGSSCPRHGTMHA